MNPFKPGDKVICINSQAETYGGPKKGQIYTVLTTSYFNIGIHCPEYQYRTDVRYQTGEWPNWSFQLFENAYKELFNQELEKL